MKLDTAFVRLPWRFDATRLAGELAQFEGEPWMDHPDRTEGNSALALISRDGGDNNNFRGEMKATRHLLRCPYVQQVIASLGEVFGRSRFMRLAPGCEVLEHVDYHYHWQHHVRIHVPVVTNPDVAFHCGDAVVNMQAGECWIFDSWRRHRVVNGGTGMRTHLVLDTAGSARFWETVRLAQAAEAAREPLTARFVPWDPAARPEILTERYNLPPVMSPGEVDHLTEDLIAELRAVPSNDPTLLAATARVMRDFGHDWRVLWYRHGIHPAGWPHYANLVARTSRAMPEADAPLLLANLAEAKAVFSARVLSVALSRDVYEDYAGRGPQRNEPALPQAPEGVEAAKPAAAATADDARCHCGSGLRYRHCHGAVRPAR